MGMIRQVNADTNSKVIAERREQKRSIQTDSFNLTVGMQRNTDSDTFSLTHMLMKLHSEGHIKEESL